jgi:hypothetical protein
MAWNEALFDFDEVHAHDWYIYGGLAALLILSLCAFGVAIFRHDRRTLYDLLSGIIVLPMNRKVQDQSGFEVCLLYAQP